VRNIGDSGKEPMKRSSAMGNLGFQESGASQIELDARDYTQPGPIVEENISAL
jgi:hypothetical protein